jgi:hypothetical protein
MNSRILIAFIIVSSCALVAHSDLLDSIKDTAKEVEAKFERTKCIHKMIDWTGADTTAVSDNATTKMFNFLCAISFNEPQIWLVVYLILIILAFCGCGVCCCCC